MALSDQEEFELLSLEREKATGQPAPVQPQKQHPFDAYGNPTPETAQRLGLKTTAGWGEGLKNVAYKAGGAVSDFGTKMGLSPENSAALGYGTNVLTQAVPALFGGRMAQEAAAPASEYVGRKLMQSAVKPSIQDLRSGDAAKGIDTLLKEGYNPTEGGVRAMQGKIDELGTQIKDAIANSPAEINKYDVARRLSDTLKRFRQQVNPAADTKTVSNAWTEFLDSLPKNMIPVQDAQAMKQGTYAALGSKPYGEVSGAATEAQKQLARGLKEEISAAVPQVAGLNQRQGDLINASQLAERRALMSGNRNPLSLAPLASGPAGAVGFLADKSDLVKALLARLSHSGILPFAAGTAAGGALGMQSGQPPDQDAQQALVQQLRQKLGAQ